MIPRLAVASKNPDKIREIEDVLRPMGIADEIVQGLDWPDVEETGETLEENAAIKARAVAEATGLPAIADDTGLEVEALGGEPGVHTARFAGPDATYDENVTRILEVMEGVSHRVARFRTVVALVFPDGVEIVAEGSVDGVITEAKRGSRGFGYDPVFEVKGRTLAEMTADEKNELSHRARAIRALGGSLGLSGAGDSVLFHDIGKACRET
ncbi:MAG: RdgB/HAM1 family non-canonical purine NTP pyrophosphatase [Thermoanaerobaculales bacterium]